MPMKRALVALALVVWTLPGFARSQGPKTASIASAHTLATQAGYEVLQKGGNAFDAAVAVSAALAVVEPFASGLGGGGFWLLHRAHDGFETMVDGRETAPLKSTRDMYLDPSGKPVPQASLDGAKAAAIPGTPAALAHLAKRYGKLPLKTTLVPAIRYAREGFTVGERYLGVAGGKLTMLRMPSAGAAAFLDNGDLPAVGYLLKQPDLARTLEAIAALGADGFYHGEVAKELVAANNAGGGIWQLKDLANYRVIERKPVKFHFLEKVSITSAAPPSSGGLTLAQALHILEYVPVFSGETKTRTHYIIEAMRRAYHDRARYLGDPDFVQIPSEKLMGKRYAARRATSINPNKATLSAALDSPAGEPHEGNSTTHFSIIDEAGNRVAATMSINTAFGSGFVAGKTGVLLNNEMDDFVAAPGLPNAYGLVGGEANAIAPGKRPLSSMSPTFVEDERGVLILGTPGGSRIISMVLLAIFDYVGQSAPDVHRIVNLPRLHHQYLPDRVEIEPDGFNYDLIEGLEAMGHSVQAARRTWGNMQVVYYNKRTGETAAANDQRGLSGGAW
jgi:gamma-glutamyltranspeptidase / glutathione hydrolase